MADNILHEWLKSLKLGHHIQAFVDNGYDNLEICKHIGEPDLDAIGVVIPSERKDILSAVKSLRENGAAPIYFTLEPEIEDAEANAPIYSSPQNNQNDEDLQNACNVSLDGYDEGKQAVVDFPKLQLFAIIRDRLLADSIDLVKEPYTKKDGSRGSGIDQLAVKYSRDLNTHFQHVSLQLEQLRQLEVNPSETLKSPALWKGTLGRHCDCVLQGSPPPLPSCPPPSGSHTDFVHNDGDWGSPVRSPSQLSYDSVQEVYPDDSKQQRRSSGIGTFLKNVGIRKSGRKYPYKAHEGDVPAHQMTMSEQERLGLMQLVKQGRITTEQALQTVRLYEEQQGTLKRQTSEPFERNGDLRRSASSSNASGSPKSPLGFLRFGSGRRQKRGSEPKSPKQLQKGNQARQGCKITSPDYFEPPVDCISPEQDSLVGFYQDFTHVYPRPTPSNIPTSQTLDNGDFFMTSVPRENYSPLGFSTPQSPRRFFYVDSPKAYHRTSSSPSQKSTPSPSSSVHSEGRSVTVRAVIESPQSQRSVTFETNVRSSSQSSTSASEHEQLRLEPEQPRSDCSSSDHSQHSFTKIDSTYLKNHTNNHNSRGLLQGPLSLTRCPYSSQDSTLVRQVRSLSEPRFGRRDHLSDIFGDLDDSGDYCEVDPDEMDQKKGVLRKLTRRFSLQRSYSTDETSDGDDVTGSDSKLNSLNRGDNGRSSFSERMKGIRKDVRRKMQRLKVSKSLGPDMFDISSLDDTTTTDSTLGKPTETSIITGVSPTSSTGSDDIPVYTGPFVARARVHTDYVPSPYDKEALTLKRGDVINIISMSPTGTWKGVCGNKMGHFKFINVDLLPNHTPRHIRRQRQRKSSPAKASKRIKPKTVDDLLQRLGLEHLRGVFLLNGYETLEDFTDIEEADLQELGIVNAESRAKLLTAAELLTDCDSLDSAELVAGTVEHDTLPTMLPIATIDQPKSSPGQTRKHRDSGCYASSETLKDNSKSKVDLQKQCNKQNGGDPNNDSINGHDLSSDSVKEDSEYVERSRGERINEESDIKSSQDENIVGHSQVNGYSESTRNVINIHTNGDINESSSENVVESDNATCNGIANLDPASTAPCNSHRDATVHIETESLECNRESGAHSTQGSQTESSDSALSDASDLPPLVPNRLNPVCTVESSTTSPVREPIKRQPPPVPKRTNKGKLYTAGSSHSNTGSTAKAQPTPPICGSPKLSQESLVVGDSERRTEILLQTTANLIEQSQAFIASVHTKAQLTKDIGAKFTPRKDTSTQSEGPIGSSKHKHLHQGLVPRLHPVTTCSKAATIVHREKQSTPPSKRQPQLGTRRRPRPLSVSLEGVVAAKLEDEMIDLTKTPYTDESGFCGIPPALVQRYAEEIKRDIIDVALALDETRLQQLHLKGRIGVPNDFLADSCNSSDIEVSTVSIHDFLTSIGLPMYLELLVRNNYMTLSGVLSMTEENFRNCGVNDPRHLRRLLNAVDLVQHHRAVHNGDLASLPPRGHKKSMVLDRV
ncbi:unnamed protein product [Owenia fusiformis]|uniref:Uncharacterized protein n=1 Tax=Owenia fusiformis TaxID=6347 RepID=A0A8J1XIX0_OWEFU|nr:unnamed protein product [Owenia fusiformis]